MDSNDMYQNQQAGGTDSGNSQSVNYDGNGYHQNPYQDSNYQQYQYNNYNGGYQMPYQQAPQLDLEEPVKLGEWMITFLIMMVPCINIIMMFVWAFSSTEKKSKSNFFKAYLIWAGIIFVLYLFLIIAMAATGYSVFK